MKTPYKAYLIKAVATLCLLSLGMTLFCGCTPSSPDDSETTTEKEVTTVEIPTDTTTGDTQDTTSEAVESTTGKLPDTPPEVPDVTIVSGGKSDYNIVYSKSASSETVDAAKALREAIFKVCSVRLPLIDDGEPATAHEILIGLTNRDESITETRLSQYGAKEFLICMSKEKPCFYGGDAMGLGFAVNRFIDLYLGYDPGNTQATIGKQDSLVVKSNMKHQYTKASLNAFTPSESKSTVLYCLPNVGDLDTRHTSFVVKTSDGKLAVIDGGYPGNAQYFINVLKKLWDGEGVPVVSAWFASHTHSDHVGNLIEIASDEKYSKQLKVEKIYCHLATPEFYTHYDSVKIYTQFVESVPGFADNIVTVNAGDVIKVGADEFKILRHVTAENEAEMKGSNIGSGWAINNTSITVKLTTSTGKTVLFLGDTHYTGTTEMLTKLPASELKSDIVAVAHHGKDSTITGFYATVSAKTAIFNVNVYDWYNDSQVQGVCNRLRSVGAECLFPGYSPVVIPLE